VIYNITCQIKSDKKIIPEDGSSLQVQIYAKEFKKDDYHKIKITVRGKKKRYLVIEHVVVLENKTGQRGTKVKTLGEEVDRIRTFGIIDLIKYVPN